MVLVKDVINICVTLDKKLSVTDKMSHVMDHLRKSNAVDVHDDVHDFGDNLK